MYVYYIVYIPSYLHYIHITVNGWWYVYVYIYILYIYIYIPPIISDTTILHLSMSLLL
jgi:hypothetical protein